jgi:hypothetical protein
LRREFVAPSLMGVLPTSLGAPAHGAKSLALECETLNNKQILTLSLSKGEE